MGLTDDPLQDFAPPLIELAFEVMNFLRVTPLIDYKTTSYLLDPYTLTTSAHVKFWKI